MLHISEIIQSQRTPTIPSNEENFDALKKAIMRHSSMDSDIRGITEENEQQKRDSSISALQDIVNRLEKLSKEAADINELRDLNEIYGISSIDRMKASPASLGEGPHHAKYSSQIEALQQIQQSFQPTPHPFHEAMKTIYEIKSQFGTPSSDSQTGPKVKEQQPLQVTIAALESFQKNQGQIAGLTFASSESESGSAARDLQKALSKIDYKAGTEEIEILKLQELQHALLQMQLTARQLDNETALTLLRKIVGNEDNFNSITNSNTEKFNSTRATADLIHFCCVIKDDIIRYLQNGNSTQK